MSEANRTGWGPYRRCRLLAATSLLLVACGGNSKDATCKKARELDLARAQKAVADVLVDAPPDMRDRYRAEGEKEIALARTHFVAVCKKQPTMDLGCYEDATRAETEACKDLKDAMWEGILKAGG